MFGWSRLAAASASARNRRTSAVGGELAGQDHLQGDDAVEADLPGPVDDAHAAAGDLLQQLVVAEVVSPLHGGDEPRVASNSTVDPAAAVSGPRVSPPGSGPVRQAGQSPRGASAGSRAPHVGQTT